MTKIQFLGAAGGVTGSSYLLITDSETVLTDLGMFQGADDKNQANFAPFLFDVKNLSAVFLTHAHLDHCGRLPLLIKQGFLGKIYATEATEIIAKIALLDSAELANENQNGQVLYTKKEVNQICDQMEIVSYDKPFAVGNLTVTFRDAGHILGSASIEISDQNSKTVVFSGDLGNTPEDLIQPTELIKRADYVVMESTYGDKIHPQEDVVGILKQEINEVEESSGVLLIPAFSIERSQEILHQIEHLLTQGQIKPIDVFLDSPMAIEVTEVFKRFPSLYNLGLSSEAHPFDFPNLKLTRTGQESRAISQVKGAKIIIAGSGMMNGGRILHHLQNYISLPSTHLLIVGYQAEGTLGREIEEGAKKISVYNETIPVNAKISKIEALSSHADQPKLLNWLKNIQGVKEVFLTHGEDVPRQVLGEKIKTELGINNLVLPIKDQVVELS